MGEPFSRARSSESCAAFPWGHRVEAARVQPPGRLPYFWTTVLEVNESPVLLTRALGAVRVRKAARSSVRTALPCAGASRIFGRRCWR